MNKDIILKRVDLVEFEKSFSFQHAENILIQQSKTGGAKAWVLKDENLTFNDGKIRIKPDSGANKKPRKSKTDKKSD